jgi:hypothetical protein
VFEMTQLSSITMEPLLKPMVMLVLMEQVRFGNTQMLGHIKTLQAQ